MTSEAVLSSLSRVLTTLSSDTLHRDDDVSERLLKYLESVKSLNRHGDIIRKLEKWVYIFVSVYLGVSVQELKRLKKEIGFSLKS